MSMRKLFGKKKEKKIDFNQAIQDVNDQLSLIEEKQSSLTARMKTYQSQAKELYRNKEQRAAVLKLKQSKMLQKELNKVEGMYILLTQQKIILEGTGIDVKVFEALKTGNIALKQAQTEAGVEQFEELAGDLEEVLDDQTEIQDFFKDIANEGNEELEEELDALIAEEEENQEQREQAREEIDHERARALPAAGNRQVKPHSQAEAKPVKTSSDDEMLNDLMA